MNNLNRSKVVVFRLSLDEWRSLREGCERAGARNLSDFTRSAVLHFLGSDTPQDDLHLRVSAIEREIGEMRSTISYLTRILEGARHEHLSANA